MMEAKSTSVAVGDSHCSKESMASLRLRWRLSCSLVTDWEAAIRLEDSVPRLFLEAGSSVNHHFLSPTVGFSLSLEGAVLACNSGRVGRLEGAGLDGPAWYNQSGGG